jgi:hypothetical protein
VHRVQERGLAQPPDRRANMGNYRDAEEKMIQFYPPGQRPRMTAVEKQIRQYEIAELLKDRPRDKDAAQAALDAENDDEVVRILFGSPNVIENTERVETVRILYRPERIKTLFVGESAPHGGDFFYYGDNAMWSHMRRAVELAFGRSDDFLKTFKSYGWYLDDLVLEPVNHLSKPERKLKCLVSQKSLADRIATYRPEAIVSVLKTIAPFVREAAIMAGCDVPQYAVYFPGMGWQPRFQAEMAVLVPRLPRLTGA